MSKMTANDVLKAIPTMEDKEVRDLHQALTKEMTKRKLFQKRSAITLGSLRRS